MLPSLGYFLAQKFPKCDKLTTMCSISNVVAMVAAVILVVVGALNRFGKEGVICAENEKYWGTGEAMKWVIVVVGSDLVVTAVCVGWIVRQILSK